jgi:hypothetical protein
MTLSEKNFSPAVTDLGLGDLLKAQLESQTEEARKSALKNQGADEARMSMSPATRELFSFLGGSNAGAKA